MARRNEIPTLLAPFTACAGAALDPLRRSGELGQLLRRARERVTGVWDLEQNGVRHLVGTMGLDVRGRGCARYGPVGMAAAAARSALRVGEPARFATGSPGP